uniref:PAP/OAS1 substrate-binding-related domain-containing protein n=1 Tax=Oryza meridionalis TaxID=40149 RepID=A0A0E0D757_9ORYZ
MAAYRGRRDYDGGWWSASGSGRMTLAAVMATRAPRPAFIRREAIRAAEAAADEVVLRVQPTEEAERTRQGIIGYLKLLFGTALGCEVFAFGSVPLKTYLPDGDIDITILGNTAPDSTFISEVRGILELEEQEDGADVAITGLQFIDAEVKLIKCVIDNVVVDISFNQIGGVTTLCLLELVDHEVGNDHLFKRSIMLIKAWCYHESHILGAHRGLISTYALEVLVLYIFNIFHKSLHSPLEVLYKFLEYFSKFDWDKYCISLNGPVPLSSLPNLTGESYSVEPSGIHDELLFGPNGSCDRLIVLKKDSDGSNMNFRPKYLNIIDPIKSSNNLGRSVSKGSFYRIRGAFSFGAQNLSQILMLPTDLIPTEIFGFFVNTLKSHGRGKRSDVGNNGSFEPSLDPESEYALWEDSSDVKESDMSEDENRSPDLQRTSDSCFYNKVSGDSFSSHSPFSQEKGNNMKQHYDCAREEYLPLGRSSMEQHIYANNQSQILTPSTRINTLDVSNSCPAETNRSDLHEEKLPLSHFSPSNLLDLSGDLDLHLECLRKVQYHLESMFDWLIQVASFSGAVNNDSFNIPTQSSFSNTDGRALRPLLVSSAYTKRGNLSRVYCSHSTREISQKSVSRTGVQVNAVCQQNVALPSGTNNRLALPPSPVADSEKSPVSPLHNTVDIVGTHGAGMHTLNNVSLLSGTDVLSNAFAQLSFPAVNSVDYKYCWSYTTTNNRATSSQKTNRGKGGTGTYIPRMNYHTYKERIFYYNGRSQREMLPDRPFKIKTSPIGYIRWRSSPEMGCSSSSNGGITFENTSHTPTRKQDHSSKSTVTAEGGFAQERVPASQEWNICTNMNMVDSQKPGNDEDLVRPNNESRELRTLHPSEVQNREMAASSSSSVELPHCVGNGLQESNTSQPSSPATEASPIKTTLVEGLEFGSFGPISGTSFLCEKFCEEFPPLPARKGPAVAAVSTPVTVSSSPAETGSKPEGLYQLRDEADFPPLKAGARNGFNHRVGR